MRLDAKWWPAVVVGALLLAGTALRLRDLGGPWGYGIRDHEGALFHRFARNAIASHDWKLWLAPSPMITRHTELAERYTNHPPLHYVCIAGFLCLAGDHEWVVRLESALFSIASILLLYAIARRELGVRGALLSAFCLALLPEAIFMATDVNFHTFNLATILLALWLYLRWLERPSGRQMAWFLGGVLVAVLSDWPSFFLVGCLPFHALLTTARGDRTRKLVWLAPALAVAFLAVYLVLSRSFPHHGGEHSSLSGYALGSLLTFGGMSAAEWVASVWNWPEMFIGAPVLGAAAAGTLLAAWRQRRFFFLLALLWIVGLANLIVFPVHATFHYQWHSYILPAVCLSTGYLASALWELLRPRSVLLASAVLAVFLVAYAHGAHTRLDSLRALDSTAAPSIEFARALTPLAPPESLILLPINADSIVCFYSDRNVMGGIRDVSAFAASDQAASVLARRVAGAGVPVLYAVPSWLPGVVRGEGLLASPVVMKNEKFQMHDVTGLLRAAAGADHRGTR